MASTSIRHPGRLSIALAAILSCLVDESGLSQTVLAELSGISQSQISKYLRGERAMILDELDALCDALGASIVDVVREAKRRTITRR